MRLALLLMLAGCAGKAVREESRIEAQSKVIETATAQSSTTADTKRTVKRVKRVYRPDGGVASETTTEVGVVAQKQTSAAGESSKTTDAKLSEERERVERRGLNWGQVAAIGFAMFMVGFGAALFVGSKRG